MTDRGQKISVTYQQIYRELTIVFAQLAYCLIHKGLIIMPNSPIVLFNNGRHGWHKL